MRSTQVVVVGAGVGGLSAAIHARLRGHDVLVLEQSSGSGGKARGIRVGEFALDPGPSIIILPQIYEAVFKAAGRQMSDYLSFRRLDPISRVCFEGLGTIDLPAGREACEKLVADIVPEDALAFSRLISKLEKVTPMIERSVFEHPYNHAWQLADPNLIGMALQFDVRKTYRELVDGMFKSPLLRSFFYGFPSYGGQSYDSKAPGALLIPYLMISDGVFYPEGGVSSIPNSFERLARELGVEFRFDSKVTGFGVTSERIDHVLLEGGEKIDCNAVISNVDRLTTRRWLGKGSDLPPSYSYFTVHWGIPHKIPGLSHHTLLVPKDFVSGFEDLYRRRQFPQPPIVYLNETVGSDPSTGPLGSTNLFAVVTAPSIETTVDWSGRQEELVQRVFDSVQHFGFHFDRSQVAFERVQTPIYFEREHGNYRGSLYGPDEKHRLFGGMFPLRNRDEEYSNLYYCGGSVQPGAGLPMVTLSGRFAAELLD